MPEAESKSVVESTTVTRALSETYSEKLNFTQMVLLRGDKLNKSTFQSFYSFLVWYTAHNCVHISLFENIL